MLRFRRLLLAMPLLATLLPLLSAQAQQTADAGVITIESDLQSADNGTGVITASGEIAAQRQVNLSPKQAGQLQ